MFSKIKVEDIKQNFTIFAFTLLYIVAVPPVLLFLTPVYLFRQILSLLSPILRPDLDEPVHVRSSVLSCDDFDTKPNWNLVIWLTHEGVLDLEKFRNDFYKEHIQAKDSKTGKLLYPEYQQHYESWCGYQFWKWDKIFDIKNHIRSYDGVHQADIVDDDRLLQIIKELTWKSWSSKRSPWEFLQIANYKMDNDKSGIEKSIFIFRIHHGIGDGYCILKLLMEDICKISLKDALGKPKYVKRSLLEKLMLGAIYWAKGPYQFVELLNRAWDNNAWHNEKVPSLKRPMNAALTKQIKLDFIKEIKNSHSVSAICSGVRKMMIKKGLDVPAMSTAIAVPMPNHPGKLRNHFIFSFLGLPTNVNDPIQRLHKVDENIIKLKRSTAPAMSFMTVPLFGGLTRWMMRPFIKNRMTTCLISNFPGTPVVPNFKGVKVLDMMFAAGLGYSTTGLGFTLISHTDHIRLLSTADPAILSTDDEVKEMNNMILQELDILSKL